VHPAHEYSFDDLCARVDEIIDHHEKRAQEIRETIGGADITAWEVTSRLDWGRRGWEAMDAGTRQAALMEVNPHLEYLIAKGQVESIPVHPEELVSAFRWLREGDARGWAVLLGVGRLGKSTLMSPSLALAGLRVAAAFDADPRQEGLHAGGVEVEPASGLAGFVAHSGVKAAILAVPARFAPEALETLAASGIERVLSYTPVSAPAGASMKLRVIDGLDALQASKRFRNL
jgi:hypothetical protein